MNNWNLSLFFKKILPFTIVPKKRKQGGQAGRKEVFLTEFYHSTNPHINTLISSF